MAFVTLGSKPVGSIVRLKRADYLSAEFDGSGVEFIVIHQGKPSSVYDDSCNGTWLMQQEVYFKDCQWHSSSSNSYADSTIHSFLNSEYLDKFDTDIKNSIKQVKIPYRKGSGSSTTVSSGSNGLPAKIFLLSASETSFSLGSSMPNGEGSELAYFKGCADKNADSKRIAKDGIYAKRWWLRSPYCSPSATSAIIVDTSGDWNFSTCTSSNRIRPAFILPPTLLVSDNGAVSINTAPSTPGSISIPGFIMGGTSISISWAKSSDAEGNISGYKVERSTNGGGSWSQIYQGTATNTTNNVPFGASSVMYRVKAYDSGEMESGWRTSSKVTVVNNNDPSAPPSITVPTDVKGGGTLVISWTAASDSDGNLSGYLLERSTNGGASYTQVYRGSALTYTDTITNGWSTVMYRVKAYDSYNAQSGYTTSAIRTVRYNTAPVINASSTSLGKKNEPFNFTYSVTDADGDTMTVTEKLDGKTTDTRTGIASGTALTFGQGSTAEGFQRILNGSHTIQITASDGKESTSVDATFTKNITSATVTLTTPLAVEGSITVAILQVEGSIPGDAMFKAEVTNNALDPFPVWQDVTTEVQKGVNIVFNRKTNINGAAFNFRITAARSTTGNGGYIEAVSGAFQ
jgi:hypothetical protein